MSDDVVAVGDELVRGCLGWGREVIVVVIPSFFMIAPADGDDGCGEGGDVLPAARLPLADGQGCLLPWPVQPGSSQGSLWASRCSRALWVGGRWGRGEPPHKDHPVAPIEGWCHKMVSLYGAMGPWGHGAMGPWGHGAMGPLG